jgi:beta-glucanase (GH16 family)
MIHLRQKLSMLALSFLLVGSFAIPKSYAETSTTEKPPLKEELSFNPVAVQGKVHGTTRIVAKIPNSDEHLVIKISNTPLTANTGDAAPTGGTVTNPYKPNTDISGVDAKINKYLGVYLTDDKNKIVTFKQLVLNDNQVQKDNWDIVWQDNFNGNSIDSSKWNFVQGGGGYGNNELENYTNRPQNARVEDGHLVIQAQKEDYQGNQYTSAKLTTEGKGDWTYGRFEIRAKLPKGQGMWPAIWMMPTDYNLYSGWPACGEIDIMELLGNDPSTVYGTLHYGLPWKHTGTSYSLTNNQNFSDSYHTFTLDWEPGEIRWYVDGVLYQKQNNWYSQNANAAAPYTYPAPFDRNFYLQLNLAVGGAWPGNPDATTSFPQQMDVDYVKVYKLDGNYRQAGDAPPASSTDSSSTLRQPTSDGNYIYNGGFDSGTTNWQFQPFEPAQDFGGSGSVAIDNGALKTTITQPGNANYAVQVVQGGLPIEKGASYKLSFDAWSDSNRTMATDISGPDQSFARYLQDQNVNLTSGTQHYEYTFKMSNDTDPNARLEFNMGGGSTSPVWIDNVRLEKLPKDPNAPRDVLPDGNYIYNGTFDEGANRELFWTFNTKTPAQADATVGSPIADRELTVNFKNPGKTEDSVRLSQDGLNMEKGKSYVLTYDAKATSSRPLSLNVTSSDLKTAYMDTQLVQLSTQMKTYSTVFTMKNDSDPHSQLNFLLGKNKESVTLDNVTLKVILPPQTLDGYGRIEAENYQSMSGVQVGSDGKSVGWIDQGDWMQYAVNVKQAGDYHVTYYVASGRDGGNVTLLSKKGNLFDGSLPQGEIKPDQADQIVTLDVPQTGGWDQWKMVSTTIHLDQGLQTLQVYAPNVNLDWMDFALKEMSDNVGVKNGTFDQDDAGWSSWWGDQWNGYASGQTSVIDQALNVHVDSVGAVSFSPQIFQDGLTFVTGQTYKVSFDAKATGGKTINVNIGKALSADPWFIPYVGTKQILLTPDMTTYNFTFTMAQPTYTNGKLVFEVGNVVSGDNTYKGDLTFDNVSITPVN